MDIVSAKVRSKIMASVRSKGNLTTELAFGKLLRAGGVRGYRKHWRVIGKPDFAWPRRKIAIFVDGCFWHGCRKCRSIPRKNATFWKAKFAYNRSRARHVNQALTRKGWTVLRIWEHDLEHSEDVLAQVRRHLHLGD
jgi:DNA mismatch endonuclease, patch repair protein